MIFLKYNNEPIKRQQVYVDAYGNAIPDTPSLKTKHANIASTIVGQRDVIVKASKKSVAVKTDRSASFLGTLPMRLFSRQGLKKTPVVIDQNGMPQEILPAKEAETIIAIPDFVEGSLHRLQNEFNRREQQLEKRFQELKKEQQLQTRKKSRLLIPVVLAAAIAGGYVLYVLTSMQSAMSIMSKSIPAMNQHMGNMAADTHSMSGNMQMMNQSMNALNGNVYHMNRQMGTMTQAMEPMGKAAGMAKPFMGMFSKFMPF